MRTIYRCNACRYKPNVEITVIRVFFIFITSLFSQANDWSFLTAFPCRKRVNIGIFPVTYWCDWLRGMWLCQLNIERFFPRHIFRRRDAWNRSLEKYRCSLFFYTEYCRAKGRQPRFNAQVALHNYVNKIIRDAVPQKNLLGNVEITVIRVFFIFITILTG
jgi:hypothetical protein